MSNEKNQPETKNTHKTNRFPEELRNCIASLNVIVQLRFDDGQGAAGHSEEKAARNRDLEEEGRKIRFGFLQAILRGHQQGLQRG
jgi:hypothetical protein